MYSLDILRIDIFFKNKLVLEFISLLVRNNIYILIITS